MQRLLFILLCATLCSCQAFRISDILTTIERQVEQAPDSALMTVQSVCRYAVLVPKHRARYGLAYAATMDKNYMNVSSDSLIRYSADYYDMYGTPLQRMQSYYYLGRTQENDGQYHAALLSFLDAAQYTDRVDNHYLKGLLYSRLAEMYEQFYDYEKAYKYFELSYNCFKLIDLKKHQAYQLYKMAEKCWKSSPDKAVLWLHKAIALATEINYQGIIPFCYDELLQVYVSLQQYEKAIEISQKINVDSCTFVRTLGALSELFAYQKQMEKSSEALQRGWSYANNKIDSSYMFNAQSRVYSINGMSYESLLSHKNALNIQLEIAVQDMGGQIANIESKYLSEKIVLQRQKAQKQKVVYIVVFVLIVLAVIAIAVYVYTKNKREIRQKDSQINQYLLAVQSLHNELLERDEKLRNVTNDIFGDTFKTINELCCTYFEYSDNPKQQSAILNLVKDLIGNIGSRSYLVQLEEQINGCYDNILKKLKRDFSTLTDNEYRLACYLCAGFTTQAICLFLNCNTSAVYNRVSRLRKKIKESASENKELFMKFL